MSSPRRAILFTLFLGALSIGLFVHRLAGVQDEAIREAERAAKADKIEEAIAGYRRALRSDFPFSSRTEIAAEALLRIGDRAREEGDEERARLAYRSLVGGMNASHLARPVDVTPYSEALSRLGLSAAANEKVALGVRPFAVLLASLGLALALTFGFRLIVPKAADEASLRRVVLDGALFAAGLALFIAGLLSA